MTSSSPDEKSNKPSQAPQKKTEKPVTSPKKPDSEKTPPALAYKNTLLPLIISIVALIGVGFLAYLQFQARSNASKSHNEITHVQASMTQYENKLSTQQTQLQAQQAALRTLLQKSFQKRKDWILNEVEYLTRIANYLLQFESNVPAAVILLNTADERIETLSSPTFIPIRDQLNQAITQLQALPQIDTEGILLKLNALTQIIESLPSVLMPVSDQQSATADSKEDTKADDNIPRWQQGLKQSLDALKEIVVIEHHDKPQKRSAAKYDRIYIDQQLQFFLQQAQWAVIHQKEALYKTSLTEAENWVKQNYANNSTKTQSMLQTLQQLAQIDIQPGYPSLSVIIQTIQESLRSDPSLKTTQQKISVQTQESDKKPAKDATDASTKDDEAASKASDSPPTEPKNEESNRDEETTRGSAE